MDHLSRVEAGHEVTALAEDVALDVVLLLVAHVRVDLVLATLLVSKL